jgi:hypothetical protein
VSDSHCRINSLVKKVDRPIEEQETRLHFGIRS